MTGSNDPLKTTLTVELGPDAGPKDQYEFTIPTMHMDIAIGARMAKLHRLIDPAWDGFSQSLDGGTSYTLRAAATLELLLIKASVTWPFSEDATKKVIVDSSKFPANKAVEAIKVYAAFDDALNRFWAGGNTDADSVGTKTVESEPDSGGTLTV